MGRPRTRRKDLPTGLYYDDAHGWYFRRGRFVGIGKVDKQGRPITREMAIEAWVKITRENPHETEPGTLGEIIDEYARRGLPLVKADATRNEYERMIPKVRALWGDRRYAKTAEEAMRAPAVFLTPGDFTTHLDDFRQGQRGAVQANRYIRFVSTMFSWAVARRYTLFNPTVGSEYVPAKPRKVKLEDATRETLASNAHPALALMMQLGALTGMRKTDLRLLTIFQLRDDGFIVRQHKTGNEQDWEITPAVREILAAAAKLTGRRKRDCTWVFPSRKGTPYTEDGLQSAWRRAKAKAELDGVDITFRDIRKRAINEQRARSGDAQAFAGHKHRSTTEANYYTEPVKVRPLK